MRGPGPDRQGVATLRRVTDPVWQPSETRTASARLADFRAVAGVKGGYGDLHRWSVEDPGRFWSTAWDWCGVIG